MTVAVLLVRGGSTRHRPGRSPPPHGHGSDETATPAPVRRFYRIRAGDTLAAIALRFGLTEVELVALNPGIEPTALRIASGFA